MSRAKRIYGLLGVLIAVCAAAFAVSRHEIKKEQIKNSDEIILTLEEESITALSWEYEDYEEDEALSFHKDGQWLWDEDDAFPVDEEKIGDLLEQFQEFGVSFIIEEPEDLGQYGLDDPVCTIRITADEEDHEILLGAYSTMDSKRYVSIGDGNVYLVNHDPMDDFKVTIRDMIKNDEVPELKDITGIRFTGAEDYSIVYEEDSVNTYCADDVYFTDGKPLDTSAVDSYISTLRGLGLTNYVTYNAADEELAAYGLDVPELTVEVTADSDDSDDSDTSDSADASDSPDEENAGTFVLHVGRSQEELEEAEKEVEKAIEKDGDEADTADILDDVTTYVRIGDSRIIYEIPHYSYTKLMAAGYNDLRHKEVLTADFSDIRQIEIRLEDETYTVSSEENLAKTIWHYDGEPEEELDISGLQDAIEALKADSFTDETPDGKEEISLTVYLDNENFPQVQIALYRYDGESCLAVVDGESFALVPRSQVVDLIEEVHGIVLG